MTRQPALENRIAVAWPMPRLAPVKISVRRGALEDVGITWFSRSSSCPALCRASTSSDCTKLRRWMAGTLGQRRAPHLCPAMTVRVSGIESHLGPRLERWIAAEFDAVVQAERTVVPEFEADRLNAPAAPAFRARHRADDVLGGDQRDRLLEGKPAFQRLRLLAGPGADLGLFRPRGEIGVGFRRRHRRHVAADAHLTAQRFPVK